MPHNVQGAAAMLGSATCLRVHPCGRCTWATDALDTGEPLTPGTDFIRAEGSPATVRVAVDKPYKVGDHTCTAAAAAAAAAAALTRVVLAKDTGTANAKAASSYGFCVGTGVDGCKVVSRVRAGGVADRASLARGDVIKAINGVRAAWLSHDEAVALFVNQPRLELVVLRRIPGQ